MRIRGTLLLLLVHVVVDTTARGYHVDFQSICEIIGVKNRLQGIEGLDEGYRSVCGSSTATRALAAFTWR